MKGNSDEEWLADNAPFLEHIVFYSQSLVFPIGFWLINSKFLAGMKFLKSFLY